MSEVTIKRQLKPSEIDYIRYNNQVKVKRFNKMNFENIVLAQDADADG